MQNADAILKQVKASIGRGFDPQAWPISMEFHEGTLRLAGELPQIAAKKTALRAAAAVDGVRNIDDRLRVGHRNGTGDNALRDTVCNWLLQQIDFRNCSLHSRVKGRRETLRDAGREASGSIEVGVEDGIVSLAGEVISLSHKRLAGVFAWWANGCRDVINQLVVNPQEDDSDDEIADALRLALEFDPYVHADRVAVTVRDSVVTLSGTVSSAGEKSRIEMDAWSLYGVDRVINLITLR